MQRVDEVSEGMTQYILVDRNSILETSFEELKEVTLTDLRKTLQVEFYGEVYKYYIQLFQYIVLHVAYALKTHIKEALFFKLRWNCFLYIWYVVRNQNINSSFFLMQSLHCDFYKILFSYTNRTNMSTPISSTNQAIKVRIQENGLKTKP